jgi:hypothetical protein
MKRIHLILPAVALASAPWLAVAQDSKDNFDNYLVDVGPGHVSAGDMLKVSASAITSIEAPKDFVALLNAADSADTQGGFGFAITPARTSLTPLSINTYRNNNLARLWGGTTFSYASNRNSLGGVDYRQSAVAVNVSYYLNANDDPHVAAYNAFIDCGALRQLVVDETNRVMLSLKDVPADKIQSVLEQSKRNPQFQEAANLAARTCANQAATPKWNASQLALTLGQGWIKAPGAGSSRLSLARTVALSGTYGPNDNTLVNFTLRRTDRALDLDTIITTAAYRKSTIAAARVTYGQGDARDLYALLEASNVKSSIATMPESAFKFALGVDKRVREGIWLEFRLGRRRSIEGGKEEMAGLFNIKFSTTTTLPKAQAPL